MARRLLRHLSQIENSESLDPRLRGGRAERDGAMLSNTRHCERKRSSPAISHPALNAMQRHRMDLLRRLRPLAMTVDASWLNILNRHPEVRAFASLEG